jgi:hypothetical protein
VGALQPGRRSKARTHARTFIGTWNRGPTKTLIASSGVADGVNLLLTVRDFSVTETVVMALVVALGISFLTWLIAGYYERRGGLGKK